jgi:hypothetical protein
MKNTQEFSVNKELLKIVVNEIRIIGNLYANSQGLILSEDDIKCLIYRSLYNHFGDNGHEMPLFDMNTKGSPLHSEIKFFDEDGKLTIRPDITILDPQYYSIKHSIENLCIKDDRVIYEPTSSKEFEFGGNAIVIEIKFFKSKDGIKTLSKIKDDIAKIEKIQNLVRQNTIWGLIVIFNKTDKKSESFKNLLHEYESGVGNIQMIYCSGMVDFSNN